jgi:hypothetical protein
MSTNGARLELLVGHMADVLAEMRALINELHAHEKNVRLRSELEYLKERVWHLCDEHAALVAHVKLETTAGRGRELRPTETRIENDRAEQSTSGSAVH